VLDARAAVVVEVLLDHERRVLGGDVLIREVDHLGEAHRLLVVLDPVVHAAELDVSHHVVDRFEADSIGGEAVRGERDVAR